MTHEQDIEVWLHDKLNHWAESGTLPLDKSIRIEKNIAELGRLEKKNRFTGRILSLITAILTLLWMLFASCPVAAASCSGIAGASHNQAQLVYSIVLAILMCCIFGKMKTANINKIRPVR